GFWYDLHELPRPGSISEDPNYHPNEQPFGIFRGNRSHSVASPIRRILAADFAWGFFMDWIRSPVPIVIEDFTSFKNQIGQIWLPGVTSMTVTGSHLAGEQVLFNPH